MLKSSNLVFGFTVAVALSVMSSITFADNSSSKYEDILEPGLGKSFVFGSKKTVTYFEKSNGSCALTLVVSEMNPFKGGDYSYATRVKTSVEPGQSTALDAAEGQSLLFKCNGDATRMDVEKANIGPVPTAKRS